VFFLRLLVLLHDLRFALASLFAHGVIESTCHSGIVFYVSQVELAKMVLFPSYVPPLSSNVALQDHPKPPP
jgi:hypothetical protein